MQPLLWNRTYTSVKRIHGLTPSHGIPFIFIGTTLHYTHFMLRITCFNCQTLSNQGICEKTNLIDPQHVGVEPRQYLSVSYEHDLGLLIPWCGPQHVGVEPSQCLSVSYEHGLGLLIPWCGPQHVGVEPSQCLSVSYEHGLGLLIP